MTRIELLQFMRRHPMAVQSSVSPTGAPQSAVVGIVVTDELELFFDTLDTSCKAQNLRLDSRIAFVIGGTRDGDERTLQYEGIADEPSGAELERLKALYLRVHPSGRAREHWPGLVYFRVRPRWMRFSDFSKPVPEINELDPAQLR